MRKLHLPWSNPNEALIIISLLLLLVGTINIFSASFVLAGQLLHDSYFFLKRHLLAFAIGLVGLVAAAMIDYRKMDRYVPLAVLITVGLLLAVHFGGIEANGARRWLKIGIKFQPSEFAKLTAIMLAAAYLGPRIDKHRPITLVCWPVIITMFMGFLVLRQPDMGTAAVIVGLALAMYVLAGIPRKELLGLFFCGIGGTLYLIFAASYRAERIMAWFDPWAYQQTSGYQTVQSLLAIGSGGFFGAGLGMGASKFYYLPEAHTDFAFAVLCQELGFMGAFLVLTLVAGLGWYGLKIALNAQDGTGKMLAAGCILLIVGQALGNIAMVCGLFPVTGVPLPFISFGGTSLMVNLTAIGILLNVGKRGAGVQRRMSQQPDSPQSPERRRRMTLVTKSI